jgi:hypothetical protein
VRLFRRLFSDGGAALRCVAPDLQVTDSKQVLGGGASGDWSNLAAKRGRFCRDRSDGRAAAAAYGERGRAVASSCLGSFFPTHARPDRPRILFSRQHSVPFESVSLSLSLSLSLSSLVHSASRWQHEVSLSVPIGCHHGWDGDHGSRRDNDRRRSPPSATARLLCL